MKELVYPRERTLALITLILGTLVWLVLIVGTLGIALVAVALGFLMYLFTQSTLISHLYGSGVELSADQFPDLHEQFESCCTTLNISDRPRAFVLNGNGVLNAFATKFLGSRYVVLLSNVVDAMREHDDGIRFYIGHELGHLDRKHLGIGHLLRWPVLWLPLIGAAYSRARESTCDRHGRACSSTPENAARALAALAAGSHRWKDLNIKSFVEQARESSGFWMSFHELTQGYPWLTKRTARVMNPDARLPSRNLFSYLLAIFVPYAGQLGAGFGVVIYVYVIGVLAAVAIPQYEVYTHRAKLELVVGETKNARETLTIFYSTNHKVPDNLQEAGLTGQLNDGASMTFSPSDMVLTVTTKSGQLIFTPNQDQQGSIVWSCSNGVNTSKEMLPPSCLSMNK